MILETIWKVGNDQEIGALFTLELPKETQVVSVNKDSGSDHPAFWIAVNPKNEKVERKFIWVGTGVPIEPKFNYLGTAHCGPLVWHLLEYNGV